MLPWSIILLVLFFGVPTLIRRNIISVEHRLFLLFGVFAVLLAYGFYTFTPSVMGFTDIYLRQGVVPWGIATLVMLCGILAAGIFLRHKPAEDPLRDPHFLFLFIPISIVQQFMYQSVLLQALLRTFAPWFAIAACALCFGYMHTVFPRRWRNFIFASLGGAAFSMLFYWYPNFLLAALSHMVLNFAAVYMGFFTLLTPEGRPQATRLRRRKNG